MILSFIEIIWEPSDQLPDLCEWHCECQRRWCRYQTGHHQRAAPLHPPPPTTDLTQINTQKNTHTSKKKKKNANLNLHFKDCLFSALCFDALIAVIAACKLLTVLCQHFCFVILQQLSCTLYGSCMVAPKSHTVIIKFYVSALPVCVLRSVIVKNVLSWTSVQIVFIIMNKLLQNNQ